MTDAGLARYLAAMPQQLVDEREVVALHGRVRAALAPDRADRVSTTAGDLTAGYLLRRRIPRPAQRVLRWLPPGIASRALMAAIERHAWTFAGSGLFSYAIGRPLRITLAHGPLSREQVSTRPVCAFYAATFQRLFRELVDPRASVVESACEAAGAPACVFEVAWD